MQQLLLPFSYVYLVVVLASIVIPYCRRKADLLTPSNVFLLGAANFMGLSGILAANNPWHYVDYSDAVYGYYMLGVICFTAAFYVTYRVVKFPRRIADRQMRKWPPTRPLVLFVMVVIGGLLTLGQLFPPQLHFVAQFFYYLGNRCVAFIVCLAFVAWFRQKLNPILWAALVGVLIYSLVLSIATGGIGRRSFMAVLIAIPICSYWLYFRYKHPSWTMIVGIVGGLMCLLVLESYTAIRFRDRSREYDLAFAVDSLRQLPGQAAKINLTASLYDVGQNTAELSLLATHYYAFGLEETRPLHSVFVLVTNPIPRAFWPEKRKGFGHILPRVYGTTSDLLTWGPGIVGHGYFEGGVAVLVFYGVLIALFMRFFDELLIRYPGNPYLLGAFVGSGPHILGWCRGDIGMFTLHILASILAMSVLYVIASILFGRTSQPFHVERRQRGNSRPTQIHPTVPLRS